ncbi:MAG: 4-hydroxy-tetrahydrodipicolinate reductase [Bacteroidales bacterium]|jgi:4-hydroxy-tetrahydrodipicolinate reductase|nr:4-hydroxy-tetrahydrodipicolinate reductase [Bacteroidales bacterium]
MKIVIIGYGKMGKEIEKLALQHGHEIILKIDLNNKKDFESEKFKQADVAIEFSNPENAYQNILQCFKANIPVVSGTTGWMHDFEKAVKICKSEDKTFFYASNFSLGVNIFFRVNEYLAKIMDKYSDYKVHIEETHHTQKLDAPSGTAISLAKGVINNIGRLNKWEKENTQNANSIPVVSFREGNVPGNHKVIYESPFDKICIEHDAKSRQGFAMGALLAAEFIQDKKGYFTMDDLIN